MPRLYWLLFIATLCRVPTAQSQRVSDSGLIAGLALDSAHHRSGLVVRGGVPLHYLDWGGRGPALVLLPGFSLTAHAYDAIAGMLARDFRVVALTPRGFGESSAPDTGEYSIETMVLDTRAVLDSLGITRATLVGHSILGSVIARFAAESPDRVTKLVFLDAFPYFAAEGGDSVAALDPAPVPPFRGDTTYARVRDFLARYRFNGWTPALEADLRVKPLGAENARRLALTASYIRDQAAHAVDVSRIAAPSLQLCAIPTVGTEYPWLRTGESQIQLKNRWCRGTRV
ncbi:MAG: alpha/beta fold hydrolase [Gemmatimonadaceae bacterium]